MLEKFLNNQKSDIWGIGIDIIEVERIRELIAKNDNFLRRMFTDDELKYCLGKKNQDERLAVRFAAKEAGWKAARIKGLALRDIKIVKSTGGRPTLKCKDARAKNLEFHVSLSHTSRYGCAMVIAVKK
ncbi:MAG TPA: holo-ACP synthase [Elusimicrobiales bacterium]|nr:holo-ACP synthase [Elusimicrobiales bacterium]